MAAAAAAAVGAYSQDAIPQAARPNQINRFKYVVLGDPGVGKTALLTYYKYKSYEMSYIATMGVDFLSHTVDYKGQKLRLNLWDTAGQERFSILVSGYVRKANCAIVCFDISKRSSFLNIPKVHLKNIKENDSWQNIVLCLVGTKCDLEDSREVTREEAQEFADSNGMASYHEVSALENIGIDNLFDFTFSKLPIATASNATLAPGANGAAPLVNNPLIDADKIPNIGNLFENAESSNRMCCLW
ncbi:MAG: GTPase Ryh1 [Marteilia pararefringens]